MKYIVIAFLLLGCRKAHLGDDTGKAYRAAIEAQRESEPERAPTFRAADAKATMAARRGAKQGAATATSSSSTITVPMGSSSEGGGAWQGAKGPITLEAK